MEQIKIIVENKVLYVKTQRINNQIWFQWEGRTYCIPLIEFIQTQNQQQNNRDKILSPMPGRIVKILINNGEKVQENQALLILSSMKMEYTLKSPGKGVIKIIKVAEEEQVTVDQELILLKLLPSSKE